MNNHSFNSSDTLMLPNMAPTLQSCCHLQIPSTQHCAAALVVPWTSGLLSVSCPELHPLHDLCHARPSCTLQWSDHGLSAFVDAKSLITTGVILAHPSPNRPIRISTDASDLGAGVVLEQYTHTGWLPLSFSRHLFPEELQYSAFDKELLAGYSAVCHLQTMIAGFGCVLPTYHKPLVHTLSRRMGPCSL